FGLPTKCPGDLDGEELLRLMWRDKKVQDGRLRFILPRRIGEVELVDSPPSEAVLSSLAL
ncbi:MAG: 3-dehydroquinate synthase, partial [Planctomycetota bacterium]